MVSVIVRLDFFTTKCIVMKKMLSIVTIAAFAVACNTTPQTAGQTTSTPYAAPAPDTAGLAQFQQWKAQNELSTAAQYNANAPQPQTQTIVKYVPVKSSTRSTSRSSGGSMNSTSSNTARAKKGWSKAAKGAVIGGVGGAVAGAVINKKNRAVGGVVGGILGAGVGYGIGRAKDKKDGRY